MTATDTDPVQVPITTNEKFPLGVNLAPSTPAGETVMSWTVTLTNVDDGTVIPITPTPTLTGTVLAVQLIGASLVAGQVYELLVVFSTGSTTDLSTTTQIVCS